MNFPEDRVPAPTSEAASLREAILVLGMHRSGTSALSGVLHKLGARAPATLEPANEFNVKGYWESQPIMQLNNRILKAAGSNWDDWTAFGEDRLDPASRSEFEQEIVDVIAAEFGDAQLILLKDPRICRMASLWLRALDRAEIVPKIVIPIRSPQECALSLLNRDKIILEEGLLLWLRHVLDAERLSRGRTRCFVTFTDLLDDWRAVGARIAEALEIKWASPLPQASFEIKSFLSGELRHHRTSPDDLKIEAEISEWVVDAYEALIALGAEPNAAEPIFSRLDEIRRVFDEASRTFGAVVAQRDDKLASADRQLTQRSKELAARILEAQARAEELEAFRAALRIRVAPHKDNPPVESPAAPLIRRLRDALAGLGRSSDAKREANLAKLLLSSGLFDPAWYLSSYQDVPKTGLDPVIHYLRCGAKEGRNPSAQFSADAYRKLNPDVAADVDPLVHFLERGLDEGRTFIPVQDTRKARETPVPTEKGRRAAAKKNLRPKQS